MASYQDLGTSNLSTNSLNDKNSDFTVHESTLATMQADMKAALKNKQRIHIDINANKTNDKEINASKVNEDIEQSVNDVYDRELSAAQRSRVIEMAWEDRTTFEAIEHSYGLNEAGVIKLMRQELKPSSFRLWRKRVSSRATKHESMRGFVVGRAYCKTQYKQR